jgi:dUTP pyrophosphatase
VSEVVVHIRRLPHAAGLPLPAKQTEHSAGFDVCAAVAGEVVIPRGEIRVIPTGFAVAIPVDFEAQIRPRSGLASKHGITLPNAPGTIDADYRGELLVPLINLGGGDFVVTRGMRIAQMLIAPVPRARLVEAEELPATGRGSGGFGSTGH